MKYLNKSIYKGEDFIRREFNISPLIVGEFREIIQESGIMGVSDDEWAAPDNLDEQFLKIIIGGKRKVLETQNIFRLEEIKNSRDSQGLEIFFHVIK